MTLIIAIRFLSWNVYRPHLVSIQLRSSIDRLCFQHFSQFGLLHRKSPCRLLVTSHKRVGNNSTGVWGGNNGKESWIQRGSIVHSHDILPGNKHRRKFTPLNFWQTKSNCSYVSCFGVRQQVTSGLNRRFCRGIRELIINQVTNLACILWN